MEGSISKGKLIAKWGIILALAVFTYSTVMNLIFGNGNVALGFINFMIVTGLVVFILYLAAKQWRDLGQNGQISFGQAYGVSFLTGLAATFLLVALTLIFMQLMGDEMKAEMDKNFNAQIEKMEADGAGEEEIEMAEKIFEMFNTPLVIGLSVFTMYGFGAAFLSIFIALGVRKESSSPFGNI